MTGRRMAPLAGLAIVLSVIPLSGIYIGVESRRVPVARLVSNLEKQLTAKPQDADLQLKLARLYGMAYALNGEDLPVMTKGDAEEVWFGHEPNLVPHRAQSEKTTRTAAAREYLKKALEHYKNAVSLNQDSLLARLGLGWTLDQSGDRPGAIAAYRAVVERAWPKERGAKFAELGQRFYSVEAAEYLIPLLDPKADAQEISELRSRMSQLDRLPRPVTPLAIPLRDEVTARSIVDLDAQVRFDADGSGRHHRWTWITPAAGWLVYDAERKGQIESALQLFGNVTFWLFWNNGYEALGALDDDADGMLRGTELRYLAIWHDRDQSATSDPGEVRSLSDHGITALSVAFTGGDGVFASAKSDAGVRFEDGRTRPSFDVILRPARSVSSPEPH
jgi:tetratricopeptide (TPR) repeat protein